MNKGFAIAFNWIFAVLAGGLIFLFLGFFAAQNTDLFGKVTTIRVGETLNTAFSGLKTGLVNTNLEFDKEIELEFSCVKGFERLKVNGKEGRDLFDNMIFSPENLKDFEFKIFTSSWKIPYRVDNFIYVLDDSVFSFIGDVPRDKFEDFSDVDINYNDVGGKIVTFDKTNGRCGYGVNKVHYELNGDEMYGTICGESFEPFDFYGDAMVYAFVFGDQFECLYPRMEEKLKIMSDVYTEKIQGIPLGICEGNYRDMGSAISGMEIIDENFYENVNLVQEKNDRIIGAGCVEVF